MRPIATKPRARRGLAAVAALGLVAALAPAAPAGALPSVYALDAGAQGLSFVYTFSGSTVDPLLNGAVPYSRSTMTSNSSPTGLSTLLYPGTLGLIYQDALGLAFSSYPPFQPLGQELGYLAPKYPLVARADGRERNSNVGAPEVSNSEHTARYAGARQQCLVADDDSSVDCSALALDVHVPMTELGASGQNVPQAVFDAWRTALVAAVRAAAPPALRPAAPLQTDDDRETFASVRSVKATSLTDASAQPASATATVEMKDVNLLAGALRLEAVQQTYEATSDGTKGTSKATTTIVGATLGDVPVTFNHEGVSFADNEAVSDKQLADANKQLGTALKDAGLTVRVAEHRTNDADQGGSVQGDGLFLSAKLANQSTVYTIQGWLASGKAEATRSPDEAETEGLGDTSDANVVVSAPVAPDEPRTAGGTRQRVAAAAPATTVPQPAGVAAAPTAEGMPNHTLAAATTERGLVTPTGRGQATPTSGGRDRNDYDRETVLALFAIWQFLGIAAVAAWGLKVTRAARAG